MSINTKQAQVQEIIKCGKDPLFFINRYCKIQHPIKGLVPFNTYDFQDDCIKNFLDHRFNIILKSRQLGISTITAAYAAWLALFHKDKQILVIATKRTTAVNFIKKVKVIITKMPKWLMLSEMVTNNTQGVEFANGSSVKAIPTSDDAGRSEALSLLIIDEAAFIKNFDDLWAGLYPTLSTGGRTILLSTPNGVGGQYYKLYTDAEAELNRFHAHKLPWYVHPDRDEKWFENECKQLSKRKVAQELLCDFTSSGETFITNDDLEYIHALIKNPIDRWGHDKNIWVWQYPLKEHNYIISADVARGDSRDFSAFHVIDTDTCEVVAEYKGKIPPDRFGEMLLEAGQRYETALICPENNSFGYATCTKLQELGYPRLYYTGTRATYIVEYIPQHDNKVPGFNTNGKTRVQILSKLEEVIRNKTLKIYSSRTYEELKTFMWTGTKPQAMKGFNDDLVISLAIGSWLFDASGDYSNHTGVLNDSMLKAMSVSSKSYTSQHNVSDKPDVKIVNPFSTSNNSNNVTKKHNNEHDLYKWLL